MLWTTVMTLWAIEYLHRRSQRQLANAVAKEGG